MAYEEVNETKSEAVQAPKTSGDGDTSNAGKADASIQHGDYTGNASATPPYQPTTAPAGDGNAKNENEAPYNPTTPPSAGV